MQVDRSYADWLLLVNTTDVIKEVALENTEEKDKVSVETDTTKTTDKTTENKNTNSKLPNTGGVQTGIFGVISALAGLGLLKKRNNKK